jgi:CheY-like chemotaxis protein
MASTDEILASPADGQDVDNEHEVEGLVAQVRDALEHLYDLRYLEQHPLVQGLRDLTGSTVSMAGVRLRRELTAAIESLNPGPGLPFLAPQARAFNLLILHYVEGMTVQEAAHKLGISRRQAHRNLNEALKGVASTLLALRSTPAIEASIAAQLSSVDAEVARLEPHATPTDLGLLMRQAQETVARLAAQKHVNTVMHVPSELLPLPIDPMVTQQVVVSTLSHAINEGLPGDVHLWLAVDEEQVRLLLTYYPARQELPVSRLDWVVIKIADRLGWRTEQEDRFDGLRTLTLVIPRQDNTILIIDDNAGLVTLVERYLHDHAYRVVVAKDGQEGIRLAQNLLPDAIVLDVMMPEMSGWEVLQRLRSHPKTARVPVIVCSVLNNPDLAYSLGASLFLPKPINREDVLGALHRVGAV